MAFFNAIDAWRKCGEAEETRGQGCKSPTFGKKQAGLLNSPCAKDSHSVAAELHNTFVENFMFKEATSMNQAVFTATLVYRKQLCFSIACDTL